MLSIFLSCDYLTKTRLFQNFCLVVLYGKLPLINLGLWKPLLITYLGKSGCFHAAAMCHTSLLHLVSGLQSLFNVVIERSQRVMHVTDFKFLFTVIG